MKQLTLKEEFTVKGKGLHTGLEIEATFVRHPRGMDINFNALT